MFRHKETHPEGALVGEDEAEKKSQPTIGNPDSASHANKTFPTEVLKTEPSLKELIEKNLKWSQIIYEQNRKINNKLLWAAIFSWLKIIIIVAPIIWAIIYFQPILKGVWAQYNELLGKVPAAKGSLKQGSLDNFFQLFNLDPAKQEQLKALLK